MLKLTRYLFYPQTQIFNEYMFQSKIQATNKLSNTSKLVSRPSNTNIYPKLTLFE